MLLWSIRHATLLLLLLGGLAGSAVAQTPPAPTPPAPAPAPAVPPATTPNLTVMVVDVQALLQNSASESTDPRSFFFHAPC